jgi:hypothetical protein
MRLREIMFHKWALLTLTGLGISGCAGTQSHLRTLEQINALSVAPASSPTHDFVVSIRNVKDPGYDPDNKATRDATALSALKTQCPAGRIVGETVVDTGTYALGNPARTYMVQVKCA